MNDIRLPPFRLIHAAYVTGDLERGKRRLSAIYGANEIRVYPRGEVEVPGGTAVLDVAIATLDGIAVEIIQPVGGKDDVYRRALSADPDDIVFHHFASRIETRDEWELVMHAVRDNGIDILVFGDSEEYKYIYLDMNKYIGHYLEYIWFVDPNFETTLNEMGKFFKI